MNSHTFVVCAYKESPYLQDCLASLINQNMDSIIICTTSTPNDHVTSICNKFGVEVCVNSERKGLAADWNFAYNQAKTDYVTIAHQDDIYDPNFLKETMSYIYKSKKPLIAFTDYYEIRNSKKVMSNRLLRIKRILNFPWLFRLTWSSRFIARRIFTFGNPICCPSVTFAKDNIIISPVFNESYKNSCDWYAWLAIRDLRGDFIYCPQKLMGHRIHANSETTATIASNVRSKEELQILRMLMPKFMAKVIHYFYRRGQKSNKS